MRTPWGPCMFLAQAMLLVLVLVSLRPAMSGPSMIALDDRVAASSSSSTIVSESSTNGPGQLQGWQPVEAWGDLRHDVFTDASGSSLGDDDNPG